MDSLILMRLYKVNVKDTEDISVDRIVVVSILQVLNDFHCRLSHHDGRFVECTTLK